MDGFRVEEPDIADFGACVLVSGGLGGCGKPFHDGNLVAHFGDWEEGFFHMLDDSHFRDLFEDFCCRYLHPGFLFAFLLIFCL